MRFQLCFGNLIIVALSISLLATCCKSNVRFFFHGMLRLASNRLKTVINMTINEEISSTNSTDSVVSKLYLNISYLHSSKETR